MNPNLLNNPYFGLTPWQNPLMTLGAGGGSLPYGLGTPMMPNPNWSSFGTTGGTFPHVKPFFGVTPKNFKRSDERIHEERLLDPDWIVPVPFGLTAEEIFAIGVQQFGWSEVEISTLFDVLIDDGYLVTEVATLTDDAGDEWLARVFFPDGEAVSELVRRFSLQRGLPDGLVGTRSL